MGAVMDFDRIKTLMMRELAVELYRYDEAKRTWKQKKPLNSFEIMTAVNRCYEQAVCEELNAMSEDYIENPLEHRSWDLEAWSKD